MKLTTTTAMTVEHNGNEITFDLDGPKPDDTVHVTDTTYDGQPCIRVDYLVHDDDASDFEWSDEDNVGAFWSGCLVRYDDRAETYEIRSTIVDYCNRFPGRVAIVHGGWNQHGPFAGFSAELINFPALNVTEDEDGDYVFPEDFRVGVGLHLIPDDVPDDVREKWSNDVLDEYASWCNGDVWGIVTHYVKPDGTVLGMDAVWGFIGHNEAERLVESGDF